MTGAQGEIPAALAPKYDKVNTNLKMFKGDLLPTGQETTKLMTSRLSNQT